MKNSNLGSKKAQFTGKEKRKTPYVLGGFAVALLLTLAVLKPSGFSNNQPEGLPFGDPIVEPRSYIGRVIPMAPVDPLIDGEYVSLPLKTVEANNIVYFEVTNSNGFLVPLMAYITPSGRIFAGSSMCEPCQGRYFSLAGETLVCDSCRTTYDIESLEFISGSRDCGSYPPVYMEPDVGNGMIRIALQDILQWEIRAY